MVLKTFSVTNSVSLTNPIRTVVPKAVNFSFADIPEAEATMHCTPLLKNQIQPCRSNEIFKLSVAHFMDLIRNP